MSVSYMTSVLGVGSVMADDVLLVDMGGGYGHDAEGFIKTFSSVFPGKIALQDLPGIIDTSAPGSLPTRVAKQKHSIFSSRQI